MTATAFAMGHHGEILQGVFRDQDQRLHRGLVTLPLPSRFAVASIRKFKTGTGFIVPNGKSKARRAVELFFQSIQKPVPDIELKLASNILEGYGLGSSTADVVASVRAAAQYLGTPVSSSDIFRIAVLAETASDSTMFRGHPRLACQREATVLERFPSRLPRFALLSLNAAPDHPVDTLKFGPARYSADEIDQFDHLRKLLRRAVERDRADLLGEVATESAIINQRYLAQPCFEEIARIAKRMGALGVQVAHSGRMIGIMVDPKLDPRSSAFVRAVHRLAEMTLLPEFHSTQQLSVSFC